MAKKEKSIEKKRKGFKRRGVIYCALIVLMIIASIVLSLAPVQKGLTKALYPPVKTITVEGETMEVYSELSVEEQDGEKIDVSAYYVLDENGEKAYLNPGYKLTQITTLEFAFKTEARIRVGIIKGIVFFLLGLFVVLLVIYLLRLSFFLSNEDAEWSQQIRDKRAGFAVFMDKLATKFSGMNKKAKKDKTDAE